MSPPELGEDDLFFTDIDRWRSRVEESKLGLFDNVIQLAWEKESPSEDCPELDFEMEYERIDATLRELLEQSFQTTVIELDNAAATQVQTCDPRSHAPIQSIQ